MMAVRFWHWLILVATVTQRATVSQFYWESYSPRAVLVHLWWYLRDGKAFLWSECKCGEYVQKMPTLAFSLHYLSPDYCSPVETVPIKIR